MDAVWESSLDGGKDGCGGGGLRLCLSEFFVFFYVCGSTIYVTSPKSVRHNVSTRLLDCAKKAWECHGDI